MTLTEVTMVDGAEVEIVAGKYWALHNELDGSWDMVELIDTATDGVQFKIVGEDDPMTEMVDILTDEFEEMCEEGRAVPVERLVEYWRDNKWPEHA